MVLVGEAVTVAPVPADNDEAGAQAYVVAPDAVSETLPPGQMEVEVVTETDKPELTVTVASAVPAQPVVPVPATL